MRILASNPDTLGDLLLRQPLYQALLDAGHQLTLIVRPGVAPIVRYVAPGADVLELPYEAYAHDISEQWVRFTTLFDASRQFAPDALLVAPYRWTLFDEQLATELPGVKCFGFNGHLYGGDPHRGVAAVSRIQFDAIAAVDEDAPEVEKNAALASTILGESRSLPYPKLDVPDAMRSRAEAILAQVGLTPGEYWIACVTGTAHVTLKAWHREHWATTLSEWPAKDRKFLFVGLGDEEPDARAVRDAMREDARDRTRMWMPQGGTIDELIGLTALSAGYVGHDTGPMHVAAALSKPVLAVFGGGHKLRFQPAVEPSVTVTVGVSCRGCEWICSFEQSHCVKAVPIEQVVRAAADLESHRVSGRDARVLTPPHGLQSQMIRESASLSQGRLRKVGELSVQLQSVQTDWQRDAREAESVVARQRAAIEQAHAELGGQLREKEATIRQQDEQLREKESMIRENETALNERQSLLLEQDAALHRTAEEADRLREHAVAASQQNEQLNEALQARATELSFLERDLESKSREADQLAATISSQSGQIDRLHQDLSVALAKFAEAAEIAKKQSDDLAILRQEHQQVDERLKAVEAFHRPRPRRAFKQLLVEFIIGAQHYYAPPPRPLPGVTIVIVCHNDEATLRDTIESVIGQTHAHVQCIVVDRGSTDGTPGILEKFGDRIDKFITEAAEVSLNDALANGYLHAMYDVLGRLDPGDVFEPGALTRVSEHFRDYPSQKAAVFDFAIAEQGWRMPAQPAVTPDVYELFTERGQSTDGVFVTNNAYKSLHGFTRELGEAAEWDFFLRLDRAYGIHHGSAHVRTIRPRKISGRSESRRAAFEHARQLFEARFGLAGRVRCGLLHVRNVIRDALWQSRQGRLTFKPEGGDRPLPVAVPPTFVPCDQPVSPLSGGMPEHLLFSTRDTLGGDQSISYVYYDRDDDTALVYPPIDLEKLQAIHDRERGHPKKIVPPDPSRVSPFAGYDDGESLARFLSRVRSPYWWFRTPDFSDVTLSELLRSTDGILSRNDATARVLVVGCFEGQVLDGLKKETSWRLFGTESNPDAVQTARGRGHTVWETSAENAALTIPIGETFDVIVLNGVLEHLPDPLLVTRRLRQLLVPGGRIVIDTPNLDSKLLDVFGPTWSQWQVPYHRTLIGRSGLRELARRASFRVERMRTTTHPLAAVRSVQLNELGLGAIVPDTAEFPPEVASRGVLLTGWARLLWDWRGKGDYLYAVLHAD